MREIAGKARKCQEWQDIAAYGRKCDEMHGNVRHTYADADHAGDRATARSTSGWVVLVDAPNTNVRVLIDWGSRRQGAVAKSTCEAEFISVVNSLTRSSLPMLSLLEEIMQRAEKASEDARAAATKASARAAQAARGAPPAVIFREGELGRPDDAE